MGSFAIGCGGDDSIATPTDGGHDGSVIHEGGGGDSGGDGGGPTDGGGGGDADAGPAVVRGKVIVTHASPDVFPLRFCFGQGALDDGSDAKVAPLVALPHDDVAATAAGLPFPGLYPGTGGALPNLTDLSLVAITGFVINAAKLGQETGGSNDVKSNANERTCDQLIGTKGDAPLAGVLTAADVIKLPTIPKGTFAHATTSLLALAGCMKNSALGIATATVKCGPGYTDATGNLNTKIVQLDRVAGAAGAMGVQFFHASTPWDGVIKLQSANTYAGTIAGFLNLAADGGPAPISVPIGPSVYGDIKPTVAQSNAGLGAANPQSTAFYVRAINGDGGALGQAALPLTVIQALSGGAGIDGGAGGPLFANGFNYSFVLLGDPDPTVQQLVVDGGKNPNYDGHGVHVIAFPTDPVLGKL